MAFSSSLLLFFQFQVRLFPDMNNRGCGTPRAVLLSCYSFGRDFTFSRFIVFPLVSVVFLI
jgi:hypothetical protein